MSRIQNTQDQIIPPAAAHPVGRVPTEDLRRTVEHVESLASLMDSQFTIPGTKIPIGLDTVVGLIPGIGDTISLGVATYIVARAHGAGVRKPALVKMGWNIFIDWLIGLVPVIGDIFDVGWRGNNRNAAILREHFEREMERRGADAGTMDPRGATTLG